MSCHQVVEKLPPQDVPGILVSPSYTTSVTSVKEGGMRKIRFTRYDYEAIIHSYFSWLFIVKYYMKRVEDKFSKVLNTQYLTTL